MIHEAEIAKAEIAIKKIILDLLNNYSIRADVIRVDTRNFTYGATEILVDDGEGDAP
jgi:hypothetical protein